MAKYWTTDLQCKVIDECLQLHGGYGYMWEYPIARQFADSRVQRIYGGTNEIMKEVIARAMGLPGAMRPMNCRAGCHVAASAAPPARAAAQDAGRARRRQPAAGTAQAAARLFRRKGFDATTTRDIAAAVGMHAGSPFYHFKSKGALLYAVMEEGMRAALARQATGCCSPRPIRLARCGGLIRSHFDTLHGPGRDFIPVMLYEWRSLKRASAPRSRGCSASTKRPGCRCSRRWPRAGSLKADVVLARLLIFGALNWSVQWFNPKKRASLDDITDAAMALFIHEEAT